MAEHVGPGIDCHNSVDLRAHVAEISFWHLVCSVTARHKRWREVKTYLCGGFVWSESSPSKPLNVSGERKRLSVSVSAQSM